jgi:ligand-binding sensor domain-containing protein
MIRVSFVFFLTSISIFSFGQNLYTEKFDNCKLSNFCLDCGETKAEMPQSFKQQLINFLDSNNLNKINGQIEIQILIDSFGKPCLLSANNQTNIKSGKLNLQKAINNTSVWKPAISQNVVAQSSVSLLLVFENGDFTIKRKIFDFTNATNEKSVGTPSAKGTNKKNLSESWTVYTQQNSELPWDVTRAVANDLENCIWIGTDNGIVKIKDGRWEHFNSNNTTINATLYNKNQTQTVRDIAVDKNNNKWFIIDWDVYKYDNKKWTKFDSTNSPINWARTIFVDNSNNVWFTSWDGIAKFDEGKWSVINTKNSELPTDKTLSVFVDSKNRLWLGTFEGNIMIDNKTTTKLTDKKSPLSNGSITQMYEDKRGNLWFDLYNYNKKWTDAGIYVLKIDGTWERIIPQTPKMFSDNSINCFLLDEDKNCLWATLNNVGILKYDLGKKDWEIYTNENSNVPSVNIEKITKDKDGAIWAATYAGVIRLDTK